MGDLFVIKCVDNSDRRLNGSYLAQCGSERTYTKDLQDAAVFTRVEAEKKVNGSEIIVSISVVRYPRM